MSCLARTRASAATFYCWPHTPSKRCQASAPRKLGLSSFAPRFFSLLVISPVCLGDLLTSTRDNDHDLVEWIALLFVFSVSIGFALCMCVAC
eukprot:m.170974 g.170974  ORF g.170974 m.170974 type:complete len:92 (+) comp10382_c4_seq1:1507-1782(+)